MEPFQIHNRLFEQTRRMAVNKSMDATMLRSKAIAHNLSNIDVPGFVRKEVAFEESLRKAMARKIKGQRTDDKHIEISKRAAMRKLKPEVYQPYDPTNPSGMNNVDVDIENAKMAENQILYNFDVKFASFEGLKGAIRGRVQ